MVVYKNARLYDVSICAVYRKLQRSLYEMLTKCFGVSETNVCVLAEWFFFLHDYRDFFY